MRKFYFLLLGTAAYTAAVAQQHVSPSVLAAGGGVSKYNNIELEWTLGEFFTGTSGSSNNLYTAGFHQPILNKQPFKPDKLNAGTITVFPNPVRDVINIHFQLPKTENIKMVLTDVNGKALLENAMLTKTNTVRMPMQQFGPGNYFITLYDNKGNVTNTFKIIKLN